MKNRLFLPITIKGKNIPNRVVLPPMVCFGKVGSNGMVPDSHVEHYRARAKGGTGLIIVEATCVDPEGRLSGDQLGIWSDDHIEGLSRIVEACHAEGAVIMLQIHHAGRRAPKDVTAKPLCPWAGDDKDLKEMTLEDIEKLKEDFLLAAQRAYQAGFDGIEIHGAHGYILSQFASSVANHRTDEYGGNLENRLRLSLEILDNIRTELGNKDFIIGYRMGGNEPTLQEGIKIARLLEEAGVDLLHVSKGIEDPNLPLPEVPKGFPFNWIVYCGTEIKRNVSIPVIVVNGIRTGKEAALLAENRLADFVSVGQGQLVDPNWTNKTRSSQELIKCLECKPRCHWYKYQAGCPQQTINI